MNRINYHKETLKILDGLDGKRTPSLILHSCCAPCSSYPIEWLSNFFDIYIDFYNPNLDSSDEYERRLNEVIRIKNSFGELSGNKVELLYSGYNAEDFDKIAKIRALTKEGDFPCMECYALRLRHSVELAQKYNIDYFTTSLSISPMKNSAVLNEIGLKLSNETGVKYLMSDFKKNDGYKRSIELSEKYELYRQDYCGCSFSKRERNERCHENI